MRERPARFVHAGGRERENWQGERIWAAAWAANSRCCKTTLSCAGVAAAGLISHPPPAACLVLLLPRAVQERGLDLGLRGSRKIVCATAAARPARRLQCASAVANNAH